MAVNVLLSYAYHEKTDLAAVRRTLVCGRVMIDSGAFTAHTTGRTIGLDEYASYLEQWRGSWDHAITLDVIGDATATAQRTRKLHARGLPVMPVFTPGGKLPEFDAMVRDCGYIAVGGLVGLQRTHRKELTAKVAMLQRRAKDLGGGIHALGVGSTPTLRATRPYSSDSSAVVQVFRFGRVAYFDGVNVVSVKIDDKERLRKDHTFIRAHGIDLAHLARAGRHKGPALPLFQAMSLSYVVADEVLRRPATTPPQPNLPIGTVLYNSVGTAELDWAISLDRLIHSTTDAPQIWRQYGHTHTCYERTPTHAA